MNVFRCQVRLSKIVQIDIPEEVLGNQIPEVLAQQVARGQYGYDYRAEVLEINRSHVADFADCHVCGIAYPSTAHFCTKCGGELQIR